MSDGKPDLPHLEVVVRRRIDGRLHGDYRGLLPGQGSEPGEARRYEPGDDVRRIDWAVSARLDRPHVRDAIADHELAAVAVVDLSASLEIGTAQRTKRELATAVTGAIAFLVARGANKFGVLALHPDTNRWVPPAAGRPHVHLALRQLNALPPATGSVDLGAGLRQVGRLVRQRGMVVVVSDFLGGTAFERPLRALARRHEVLTVEITDPIESLLPNVGYLVVADAETGRRRGVDTADAALRSRYTVAATKRSAELDRLLRRAGTDHLVLSTGGDWLTDLVRHVERRRRTRHVATVR